MPIKYEFGAFEKKHLLKPVYDAKGVLVTNDDDGAPLLEKSREQMLVGSLTATLDDLSETRALVINPGELWEYGRTDVESVDLSGESELTPQLAHLIGRKTEDAKAEMVMALSVKMREKGIPEKGGT